MIALLEIGAAQQRRHSRSIGPRLFLGYGVLAIAHVLADVAYLVSMPSVYAHGMASEVTSALAGVIGVFHLAFSLGSFAWAIVVLVLAARWRHRFIT